MVLYRMSDIEILKYVVDKMHSRGARGMMGIRRKFAVFFLKFSFKLDNG